MKMQSDRHKPKSSSAKRPKRPVWPKRQKKSVPPKLLAWLKRKHNKKLLSEKLKKNASKPSDRLVLRRNVAYAKKRASSDACKSWGRD